VRIICSAATPLQSLFVVEAGSIELEDSRVLMDDLDLSQVRDTKIHSLL